LSGSNALAGPLFHWKRRRPFVQRAKVSIGYVTGPDAGRSGLRLDPWGAVVPGLAELFFASIIAFKNP